MNRDRASGWQYAKLSGHINESAIEQRFNDSKFKTAFSKRLGIGEISSVSVGGLHETDVRSVFGDMTKSKTDLTVTLKDGKIINISIKKSSEGQVYLIGVERFIKGFEKQFARTIPDEIKELLHIYFFGSQKIKDLLNNTNVTKGETDSLIAYQNRHNRLVWTSIENWDIHKKNALLNWFKDNISDIADFCFARGLAADKKDWAQYIWYINLLGEDDFDEIFSIEDIKKAAAANTAKVYP
ncbi:MAG TPA: hypothetical protein IAC03_06615 [Candidatus Coprenecus pullistercoris]|nr:hypothetical protein [Candidatus Coprenecus pullistercoris]